MVTLGKDRVITFFDAVTPHATDVSDAFALPSLNHQGNICWQTSFGTNPDAVNIILQVSLDNTVWATLDTTTAVAGELRLIAAKGLYIRARQVSNTNGDDFTVKVFIS